MDRQRGGRFRAGRVLHRVGKDVVDMIAGVERIDGRVVVVDRIAVAAVGVERKRAVLSDQRCVGAGGDGVARLISGLDAGHGLGFAIGRTVGVGIGDRTGTDAGQNVESGNVGTGRAVVGAAGLRGVGGVGIGSWIVVGALDGDRHLGGGSGARRIVHGVAERIGQRLRRGAQRLHGRIGVIDDIGVGAVGGDGQRTIAVGADDTGADIERERPGLGAGRDALHGLGFAVGDAVHIGVVGQHVAAGIGPRGAVADTAGFDRDRCVGNCDRGVVGAVDGDRQGCGVLQPAIVLDRVVEGVGQCLRRGPQRLHGRVRLIHRVGV
jgi:hypothetical protein